MTWVPIPGDRILCDIHNHAFGRLEQCPDCLRIRLRPQVIDATEEKPAEPPEGCISAEVRERTLTAMAMYAEEIGRKLSADGPDRHIPHAAKMFEVAIKAHRAAGEYGRTRDRKGYVVRLEKLVKQLRGGSGGRN